MDKVIFIAPYGEGVGGILCQTNALIHEFRCQNLAEVVPIDSAQRYRHNCDLSNISRLKGGTFQAIKLAKELLLTARKSKATVLLMSSSASLGLIRDLALAILGRLLRLRVYISFHFGRIPQLKAQSGLEWRLLLLACRFAHGIVVLDQCSKASLVSALPGKQIKQFPNGIDIGWVDSLCVSGGRSPKPNKILRLLFVGMLLPAKGVFELVTSCSLIHDIGFVLEMVGPVEDGMRAELCNIAKSRDGGNWLLFTGALDRDRTVKRVAAADIFVLPSHTEGFPISILEAMACGKPTVATDVGAIPEMLSSGSANPSGICVPARQTEFLGSAIQSLLLDEGMRAAMGHAAREKCEKEYQLCDLARRWVTLFKK